LHLVFAFCIAHLSTLQASLVRTVSLSYFALHVASTPSSCFFSDTATPQIYTLSLHDALPISDRPEPRGRPFRTPRRTACLRRRRSEEHTSELQSRVDLVCRLLLEKKKKETRQRSRRGERGLPPRLPARPTLAATPYTAQTHAA